MQPHALALALILVAAPAAADPNPNPQLALQVSLGLERYGISVPPGALTIAQAAALHNLLARESDYLVVRRRARAILRSPDYRDGADRGDPQR